MPTTDEHGRSVVPIALEPAQLRYLESMMASHSIPDVGKAVRVLVNYAMAMPDQEDWIFKKTRCRHCG